MKTKDLLKSPPSREQCFDVFGDFRLLGWKKQNLIRCDLSQFRSDFKHVVSNSQPSSRVFIHKGWFGFPCHRLVVPKFQKAFQNVVKRGLANELKTFDGCYNKRKIRGSKIGWSTHSWGIAIDLNVDENRQGQQNFKISKEFVKCFEDVGFIWGGRWIGKSVDAMHFQYATVK